MRKIWYVIIPIVLVVGLLTACSEWPDIPQGISDVLGLAAAEETDPQTTVAPNLTESPETTEGSVLAGYATVTGHVCNLREGPGTEYSIVGTVQNEETIPVYGRSENGQWLLIDNEQSVWISLSLVAVGFEVDSISVVGMDTLTSHSPVYAATDVSPKLPEVEGVESGLTCDEIFQQHKDLTDFQWEAYVESITGSPIDFLGKVEEVKSDGSIEVRACSGLFKHATFTVYGVSKETGLAISRRSEVIGEGTIMQVYRKNTPQKGLFGTRLQEWLYIDVEGSLEPVE